MEEIKTKEFSGGLWGSYPKKKLESRQQLEKNTMSKEYIREEQCAECQCHFNNQEEGSEVYEVMEEAQIECSNEYTFVDKDKPCFCFQKVERKNEK